MKGFKEKPKGVLVSMDVQDEGPVYSVWFPYAKSYVQEIKVGSFVAVRNYKGLGEHDVFSILEIVSAFPKHYALGSSSKDTEQAFPGFVIEAAKNVKVDWAQEEPVEETTKIKADAIATGLQLTVKKDKAPSFGDDESLPLVGEYAHLLTSELIEKVVNREIRNDSSIEPCSLVSHNEVPIKLRTDELIKTHFGVFGFTGAGKSNLLSTLISNLLSSSTQSNVVLFDLMSEYTGLLIDLLHKNDEAYLLCTDKDSLPGSKAVEEYVKGNNSKLDEAAESILRTMLLPKELIPHKGKYLSLIKEILKAKKIRLVFDISSNPTIREVKQDLDKQIISGSKTNERYIRKMIGEKLSDSNEPLSDKLRALNDSIKCCLAEGKIKEDPLNETGRMILENRRPVRRQGRALNETGRMILENVLKIVEKYLFAVSDKKLPEDSFFFIDQLYEKLCSKKKPALIVIQSNRDDDLREFSEALVNYSFKERKLKGDIDPNIVFLYDEADEFIPQEAKEESYAKSKRASTLLARRGRKFGLGIGLSTQRVARLDTSILAQLHTFFLSKLPRKYDRDIIGSAFGTSDKMMERTLTFTKGQWMLFSYDATGLPSIPLPVKFENANDRIIKHLENGS